MAKDPPFSGTLAYVEYVEGALGWCPPDGPRWKTLSREASMVMRRMETNPALYTFENMKITVDWLRVKRFSRSPLGAMKYVPQALKAAWRPSVSRPADIKVAIDNAIDCEQEHRQDGWQDWVGQLARAQGTGREEVYSEWLAARGVA